MAKIEHVALYGADPSALKDFYVSQFGLKVILDNSQGNPPGYFLADDHGTAFELIGRPEGESGANQRYVCHVAFVVEDVADARTAIEARGLFFETDTVVDNESMETCFFNDPEGNRIQIVKRRKPLGN